MSATENDPYDLTVRPTEWALILADWRRSEARVTVYLRGGGQPLGPGKVTRIPGPGMDSAELTSPRYTPPGEFAVREKRWTFDLNEIVAIEAEAPR